MILEELFRLDVQKNHLPRMCSISVEQKAAQTTCQEMELSRFQPQRASQHRKRKTRKRRNHRLSPTLIHSLQRGVSKSRTQIRRKHQQPNRVLSPLKLWKKRRRMHPPHQKRVLSPLAHSLWMKRRTQVRRHLHRQHLTLATQARRKAKRKTCFNPPRNRRKNLTHLCLASDKKRDQPDSRHQKKPNILPPIAPDRRQTK
mmetsp:Transcript_5487/g.20549  ORF Transcript_5487/g.20549 Transcript_5487/m.20549 type:complete len:200 (-) Transcript_5487:5567-6166(-)